MRNLYLALIYPLLVILVIFYDNKILGMTVAFSPQVWSLPLSVLALLIYLWVC